MAVPFHRFHWLYACVEQRPHAQICAGMLRASKKALSVCSLQHLKSLPLQLLHYMFLFSPNLNSNKINDTGDTLYSGISGFKS